MLSKDNTMLQVKISKVNDSKLETAAKDLGITKTALVGLILASVLTYEGGKHLGAMVGDVLLGKDVLNG